MKQEEKSSILKQLTLAALLLPGLDADVVAGRVEETYNADFQYGHYSENGQRIDVDIFEGNLSAPIGKSITASMNIVRDVISGASPVYNKKDSLGNAVQVMSGASPKGSSKCTSSICDERIAFNPSLTYFLDTASVSLAGGYSDENDYTSRYVSTNVSMDFNKKLTTLNFGGSVAFDEANPHYVGGIPLALDGSNPNDQTCGKKCHKTSQQYLIGFSQILDKESVLLSNMTFSYNTGYLSDPYKLVSFYYDTPVTAADGSTGYTSFDTNMNNGATSPVSHNVEGRNDTRPREKFQWAWLTQYVRHFGSLNDAALHADYRFTADTFGINSHTVELSWHQPIVDDWQVIGRFRYYSQDSADFYQPVFNGNPANYKYYSNDYRLAGFGAFSGGLKLTKEFREIKHVDSLKFLAGVEYYDHKASYQLGGSSSVSNFADFNYYLVTASFNLKF
jgi:hypothetical protein